jgi:hypothetical protein
MDMLLRHVTMDELAELFRRNEDGDPAPYFKEKAAVARAVNVAKKNGIWEELDTLDTKRDIPVMKRSHFRNYRRNGDRGVSQSAEGARRQELGRAAMALWLGHPAADKDYLQDLLWAYCDDWTWVWAAHENLAVDLGSARLSAALAGILHVLGPSIEEEVKERLSRSIEQRIFDPFWNYRHKHFWKTCRGNWNHECNGRVVITALYQIQDPNILAHMTHAAIQNMTYALDGFADDGGCKEGPGYWTKFGVTFVQTALALYHRTNGELNIMREAGGKIERICRSPLATQIKGPLRSTFADSHHGYIPTFAAVAINTFFNMPELYRCCELNPDRTLRIRGHNHYAMLQMHELALCPDITIEDTADSRDYCLPDLGQVKMRSSPGKDQMTLCCLAGHNGVPHNHNDIGSFIVHKHDYLPLADPGGPIYSSKTFGPQRYEILFCNSYGHSVPVINGVPQSVGPEYFGTLQPGNLNGSGLKKAVIDMTHAYPKGTVRRFVRTFSLAPDEHTLQVDDAFEFEQPPQSLEEAFITLEDDIRVEESRAIIGTDDRSVVLSAENAKGRFQSVRMTEESKEGGGDRVVTRITFIPDSLDSQMTLRFRIV